MLRTLPRRPRTVPVRPLGVFLALAVALGLLLPGAASPAFAEDRDDANGRILAQELNDGQGYTVVHVWGSHYEMGYAHGYLLADYVQLAYEEFSTAFGYLWELARTRVSGWTFLPETCNDEFLGMLDGVRAVYPDTPIDLLDLMTANTIGDWLYGVACRSTCCWDELPAPPHSTLAMRKLQFSEFPPTITQQWHHVICAWDPEDGSPRWVNFGFPSHVSAVTGVNEYGTIASLHDWNSSVGPDYPDALPRTMACRYVLTMDLGPDPLTHLSTAFDAITPYHAATGGFLNYYVPDGGAGVIKHSKSLGYYDTRLPQPAWMDGHVISTNNSDIDGTTGIYPWLPYYESLDPQQGVYATMQGLWETGYQSSDMHMVALGFREEEDMTLWFEGRLDVGTTGRVELEWEDLFRDPGAVDDGPDDPGFDPTFASAAGPRAHPNPATGAVRTVVIPFRLAASATDPHAELQIFEPTGRLLRRLKPDGMRAGEAGAESAEGARREVLFRWDGRDARGQFLRPGIYLYRFTGDPAAQGGSGRIAWLGP